MTDTPAPLTAAQRFDRWLHAHFPRLWFWLHVRQLVAGLRSDLDLMADHSSALIRQLGALAALEKETERRLVHHEVGPLAASAAKLNGARKAGIITLDR